MQLLILLKKDLTSLFQQKAVLGTLLIPMFFMASFGLLPTLLGVEGPFEVYYLNEDVGIEGLNLGDTIIEEMQKFFNTTEDLKLIESPSEDEFLKEENGFWLPENFTFAADMSKLNENVTGLYYMKYSETNLRSDSVMNGIVATKIEEVVVGELLIENPPRVDYERKFADSDKYKGDERKRRSSIAFPLAYMAFLILILSGSSMRVTGFSAEKQSGMMELLMSSVIFRREMVLSKLITGVIYGLVSVLSYMLGIVL
ncbi:MAG: ABC transporter permease, partial [Candidatus Kariarchaeaceae archaeon]